MRNVSINTVAEHLKMKVFKFEEQYTMTVEDDQITLCPKNDKTYIYHVQWVAEVVSYFERTLSVKASLGEGIYLLIH